MFFSRGSYSRAIDAVLGFGRIVSAAVEGASNAVIATVHGAEDESDRRNTEVSKEGLFGQLGVIARPRRQVRPSEATPTNPEGYVEVIAARFSDAFSPIASRDLRINRRVKPKEGDVNLAHDRGGFVGITDASSGFGSQVMLYAPKLGGDGEPEKAHALVLDPAAATVTLAQAEGSALILTDDGAVVRAPGGSTFINTNDNEVMISAPRTFIYTGSFQVYVPNADGSKAHTIVVDDSLGAIQLVHRSGSGLSLNDDGSIVLRTPGGLSIQLSDAEGCVIDAPTRIASCAVGQLAGLAAALPVALGPGGMGGQSTALKALPA